MTIGYLRAQRLVGAQLFKSSATVYDDSCMPMTPHSGGKFKPFLPPFSSQELHGLCWIVLSSFHPRLFWLTLMISNVIFQAIVLMMKKQKAISSPLLFCGHNLKLDVLTIHVPLLLVFTDSTISDQGGSRAVRDRRATLLLMGTLLVLHYHTIQGLRYLDSIQENTTQLIFPLQDNQKDTNVKLDLIYEHSYSLLSRSETI